jgi:hypothetical protein
MNLISSIIVALLAIMTMAIVAAWAVSNLELFRIMTEAKNNIRYDETDEFEFRDDPYAVLTAHANARANAYDAAYSATHSMAHDFVDGVIPRHLYTCHLCPDVVKCGWAFDHYNLDGDCLAAK